MKVVVDTNVLLSGIFFGGTPGRIVDAWRSGRLSPVVSPEVLDEYFRTAARLKARHSEVDAAKAGGATVVISGDDDLLSIGEWQGIRILTPRAFADEYLGSSG